MYTLEDIRGTFGTLLSISVDLHNESPTITIELSTIDGEIIKVIEPLEKYDTKKYLLNINQKTLW